MMRDRKSFDLELNGRVYTDGSCPSVYYRRENGDWIYEKGYPRMTEDGRMEIQFSCFRILLKAERTEDSLEIGGMLYQESGGEIEIARVNYFDGPLTESFDFLPVSWRPERKYKLSQEDTCVSYAEAVTALWEGMGVHWERLMDPVYLTKNCVPSQDLAVLTRGGGDDVVIGFIGPGTSFGETVYFMNHENRVMIGPVLDGAALSEGDIRVLETCGIYTGDWQEQKGRWAERCLAAMSEKSAAQKSTDGGEKKDRLKGYCSWYQFWDRVTADNFEQAVREFPQFEKGTPSALLQLDDGFEDMPGNWEENERFAGRLAGFPKDIRKAGYLPGIWLAPTAVLESAPFIKGHPERVQRNAKGEPCVRFSNWNRCSAGECADSGEVPDHYPEKTYFLEPDRPDVREFIKDLIRRFTGMGWKYLKLDFLYALSTSRCSYDKKKTGFETLRELFGIMREAAGEDTWICSCTGGISRYALGYADSTRVGGDTGADFASVKDNLWDYFMGTCTNRWWQCDPDVFYMRKERTGLNEEESRLVTGTIGYTGGCFQTSDYPSQWEEEAGSLIRSIWEMKSVPKDCRILPKDGEIRAVLCRMEDENDRLLVYHWGEERKEISLTAHDLKEIGYEGRQGSYSRSGVFLKDGQGIQIVSMEPHSLCVLQKQEEGEL